MESGGDNKGSITGASDERDGAGARANRPRTEMQDSWVFYNLPLPVLFQVVDFLPDPSHLSLQAIDIRALPPSEDDNPNDLLSLIQGYEVNVDEMRAASALTIMKHQVQVHQSQTQQSQMEQSPSQLELLASDGDHHHHANALGIPKRPRSHRPRILRLEQIRRQVEFPALDDHHHANAAGASPRKLRIPGRPRSQKLRIPRRRRL